MVGARGPQSASSMPSLTTALLLAVASGLAAAFDYKDCGSPDGYIMKVAISECDPPTGPFCTLKKGTNATLFVKFQTNKDVSSVKAIVHGIIGGLPIPFPLPNSDGCVNSNLVCPLAKSSTYTYKSTLPVLSYYPKIHLQVKWELQDESKKDVICFTLPAKLV